MQYQGITLIAEPRTYHGKAKETRERYCSWARTHDDDDDNDGVAQHGGHTPKKRQPWFTVYFVDFGYPYYNQLTTIKTRYPLTSIT